MFASAAAGAFPGAGTAFVFTVAAVAAIAAAVAFSAKIAAEECFAFSSGKDGFRLFIKAKTGRSVPAFFIYTVVTNKIAVGNFLSAFSGHRNAVRDKIMSFSAVFAFAFMFHWQKPFQ